MVNGTPPCKGVPDGRGSLAHFRGGHDVGGSLQHFSVRRRGGACVDFVSWQQSAQIFATILQQAQPQKLYIYLQ